MFSCYDTKKFSLKISEIRKGLGYSREYVSNYTGINTDTIRKIEKGVVIPRFDTLELLSSLYKINLLHLLDQYKSNSFLTYIYDSIDYCTARNDKKEIQILINSLPQNEHNKSNFSLVNPKEYEQLLLFLDALSTLYGNDEIDYNQVESLLIESIKMTIPTFSLSNWFTFIYSHLEIRILYSLSTVLLNTKNYPLCIDILHFILKNYDYDDKNNMIKKILKIKVYTMLSYSYHLIDRNEESLSFSEMGIEFCIKNNIMDNLPLLLSRKGIALFRMEKPNYIQPLVQSLQLLLIQENYELAELYKSIYSDYKIDLFFN